MAGNSKISVLSFGTMGEEVSMVHWLWHIYFGSILIKSLATAIFIEEPGLIKKIFKLFYK